MRPAGRGLPDAEGADPVDTGASVVEIGRIVARHGVRGDVRVLPHNPDSLLLSTLTHVLLQRDGHLERRRLLSARPHKRVWLAQFEGVDTADAADDLIGSIVCVPREELPTLAAGEVYYVELIGCPVRSEAGVELGTVERVFSNGSTDVCVVAHESGEYLIPLIADVVARLNVSPPNRELVIRPLPGLLDDE